jgi:hypothetical protein
LGITAIDEIARANLIDLRSLSQLAHPDYLAQDTISK